MTLLDDVLTYPAFALVRLQGSDAVTILGGSRADHEELIDIPLAQGAPPSTDGGSTGSSVCRTRRSASAGSRPTRTARH